jgi:hypothetical protein
MEIVIVSVLLEVRGGSREVEMTEQISIDVSTRISFSFNSSDIARSIETSDSARYSQVAHNSHKVYQCLPNTLLLLVVTNGQWVYNTVLE